MWKAPDRHVRRWSASYLSRQVCASGSTRCPAPNLRVQNEKSHRLGGGLGDGLLANFSSARDAVAAALTCEEISLAHELPLHIGLHAGDVLRERGNLFGGAVNLAARVCSLCEPGRVLASQTFRDMART